MYKESRSKERSKTKLSYCLQFPYILKEKKYIAEKSQESNAHLKKGQVEYAKKIHIHTIVNWPLPLTMSMKGSVDFHLYSKNGSRQNYGSWSYQVGISSGNHSFLYSLKEWERDRMGKGETILEMKLLRLLSAWPFSIATNSEMRTYSCI